MLVSIIIPVYNREVIIKSTLDSIIKQTYINWECIIVDDSSTDDTIETLKKYVEKDKRFKVFQRPQELRKGANSCRNYGFLKSKGFLINWFDSDDIMSENFIEEKAHSFKSNIDAVLHRNRYANYELTRFRDSKFEYNSPEDLFYHYAIEDIELQTCCFMWRKDYLEDKQLFNETIDRYQDNDFHIRILSLKPSIKVNHNCLATIRGGDGDKTQISSRYGLNKKKILDRFNYLLLVLELSNGRNYEKCKVIQSKISKKAIWSFYEVLKFEKNFFKRIQDIRANYSKLGFIYRSDFFSIISIVKSHLYILYILVFGNFTLIKN